MLSVVLVQGVTEGARHRHAARLSAATGTPLVTFSGTAPDPEETMARALRADRSLIIEVPTSVEATHVVALAVDAVHDTAAIETVVDARTMLRLLGLEAAAPCSCGRARRLVEQLEQSTMVTIVRWHTLETHTLSALMALVSHLAPRTRLRLDRGVVEPVATEALARVHDRAGWTSVLNGDHDPHMTDPQVSAIHFEHLRPFHPERLRAALDVLSGDALGRVVRSAGLISLASRPDRAALWDHVAGEIDLHPLPDGEPGIFGQELALFGVGLDHDGVQRLLADATLDDAELTAGADAWARYRDPFPDWHSHTHS